MPMDGGCGIERGLRVLASGSRDLTVGISLIIGMSRIAGWLGPGREIDVEAVFFGFDGGLGFQAGEKARVVRAFHHYAIGGHGPGDGE